MTTRVRPPLTGLLVIAAFAAPRADFVVLDANPLDDITNSRRISRVYMRGAAVDRAALRTGWTGRASQ